MVEAAGGVVWRTTEQLQVEVLLIHRPQRQDWSLPKGKCRPRESALHCALREVREETGLRCEVGRELPETNYIDRKGRPKRVQYWSMQPLDGRFRRNREVDEVRWLAIDRVAELLTYEHDLIVVEGLQLVGIDAA